MSPNKRKPLRLDRYKRIHDQNMAHLEMAGFVIQNHLKFLETRHEVLLYGQVVCISPILLKVNKKLSILDRDNKIPVVKSRTYEYNVSLTGMHNLFRYDNTHRGDRYSGHFDDFHKHEFDIRTGIQRHESPIWVGEHQWPTLDQVIEEACAFYFDHKLLIDTVVLEHQRSRV